MNKFVMVFLAAASAAAAHAAAKTGSIESAAASLGVGKSVTVKLVPEYEPDEKTYDEDSGVYFLKTTLTKGYAYTLAYTGASADDVDVNGYPRETTEAEDEKERKELSYRRTTILFLILSLAVVALIIWEIADLLAGGRP